jgi:hypothetical protein
VGTGKKGSLTIAREAVFDDESLRRGGEAWRVVLVFDGANVLSDTPRSGSTRKGGGA